VPELHPAALPAFMYRTSGSVASRHHPLQLQLGFAARERPGLRTR
jgi:hypothetical protein